MHRHRTCWRPQIGMGILEYSASNNAGYGYVFFSPVTLTGGTKYHLGMLATNSTNLQLYEFTTATASQMAVNPMGQNFLESTRNGAAWSADVTTVRPGCAVMVTQVDQ